MTHRCTALALLVLSLCVAPRTLAQETSPLSLRLQLDAGVGVHSSSLPGANGTRRIDPAWFPAVGFRVLALQAARTPLRFGAELSYVTSTAFDVSSQITPSAVEQGNARAQELSVLARMALGLKQVSLPISLGYAFDAFTTNVQLTAAQAYLLSGPRAALGIELPLWAERLHLAARAELGANVTATAALRSAGVRTLGVSYAVQVEADVEITDFLRLGVRVRQADVQLPVSGAASFHEQRRYVLASLMLRNPG